jgi:hypothetical protein
MPVSGRGSGKHAPKSLRRSRRSSSKSEENLRALGDQVAQESDSSPAKATAASSRSDGDGGRSHGVANEVGLAALGEEMHRSGAGRSGRPKGTRDHRGHRVRNFSLIGLAVLLVAVGGGAGYVYYLTHDLKRVEVHGLSGTLTTGLEGGTENILMVGSTSRCALKQQNLAYG